jgi:hypothetical protein
MSLAILTSGTSLVSPQVLDDIPQIQYFFSLLHSLSLIISLPPPCLPATPKLVLLGVSSSQVITPLPFLLLKEKELEEEEEKEEGGGMGGEEEEKKNTSFLFLFFLIPFIQLIRKSCWLYI